MTSLGSNVTHKLERLAGDKHASLLCASVNYGFKKFYYIGPVSETLLADGAKVRLVPRVGS